MNITIILPWPDYALSQNARQHWRVVHEAKRSARMQARALTLEAVGGCIPVLTGDLAVKMTVVPPSRRYDLLNCVGMLKSWVDGIFDALQENDRRIKHSSQDMADPQKPGWIILEIMDNWQ